MKVSKSAYYDFKRGQTYQISLDRQLLLKEVKAIFDFHKRRYGARRILEEMRDNGYKIGIYLVRNLMAEQNLIAIQPKQFVPRTTKTNPNLRRSPNLLLDLPLPSAPNEVVVGDITYLPLKDSNDWLYLTVWMDLIGGRIPLPEDLPRIRIVLEPEEDTTGMVKLRDEITEISF